MRKRVVITGLGCITPLGNDVKTTWVNILAGKSGAAEITNFDPTEYKTKFAAEVKGFDGAEVFGYREAKKLDRFAQFALAATNQAISSANLEITDENRDRIGVVIGTGIGGMETLDQQMQVFYNRGPGRVSPFLIPMMLPDTGAGMVAIQFGVRGPNMAVVTACATGTNAIGEAVEIIRRDAADVMIAGGSEAAIIPIAVAGLIVMGALSRRNDHPERASRPFDLNRDGFVIGEGSAVVILEELEHAMSRGASILAEVSGYGTTNDAFHISAPAENGEGAARCMQMCIKDAGLSIYDIDYINAHGTATGNNDLSEGRAFINVFGENVPDFSSTKAYTGHTLAAAGAIEAVYSVLALQNNLIFPNLNFETPMKEFHLRPQTQAKQKELKHVLSNSLGFGGNCSTLIFSKEA